MDKGTRIRRIGVFAVAAMALCMVGAFAIVSKQPAESKNESGTLESVVEARETWDMAFPAWSGKAAPDFTVIDVDGTEHRLSDYLGRDVLVVFWATWCPACKAEIPHLIELRKQFGQDELAILAMSNEAAPHLKRFADSTGINYSVASLGSSTLPEPYAAVRSIPTSFFIDRHGIIKLSAVGLVSLEDSRAILQAEL